MHGLRMWRGRESVCESECDTCKDTASPHQEYYCTVFNRRVAALAATGPDEALEVTLDRISFQVTCTTS